MKLVVFFLAVFHLINSADAAEIIAVPKTKQGLYMKAFAIEGNIEKGDFENLINSLAVTVMHTTM